MFWAYVIRNGVKKNLHSLFVRSGDEVLIILQRAEMWINGVEVHGAVTVIVLRSSILHDGCEPERGHPKLLQIRQMTLNPSQVASMVCAGFRTIVGTRRFGRLIIRGIAVGEAVRHDEIQHVILRQPLKLSQRRSTGSERQFERGCSFGRDNSADGGS